MITRYIAAGVTTVFLFAGTAGAQGHAQFNDKDRQAASDWNGQHQAHPAAGFRTQDRLSPEQESRLKVGSKLDADLQKRVHPVPAELRHRLSTPAPTYRYAAIGGHVTLLDKQNQVHDIIHVHP